MNEQIKPLTAKDFPLEIRVFFGLFMTALPILIILAFVELYNLHYYKPLDYRDGYKNWTDSLEYLNDLHSN